MFVTFFSLLFICKILFYAAVQVEFAALSYSVSEGAGSVVMTISRIGASSIPVTVSLIVQNGTAIGTCN